MGKHLCEDDAAAPGLYLPVTATNRIELLDSFLLYPGVLRKSEDHGQHRRGRGLGPTLD